MFRYNLQEKMTETWIANGVKIAWLIDPFEEKAYIYRADGTPYDEAEVELIRGVIGDARVNPHPTTRLSR